jgi:hypothetical protein
LNLAIMQWREENFPDEYPVTALYWGPRSFHSKVFLTVEFVQLSNYTSKVKDVIPFSGLWRCLDTIYQIRDLSSIYRQLVLFVQNYDEILAQFFKTFLEHIAIAQFFEERTYFG